MKPVYGPFWAELTGYCYATSIGVFDYRFFSEPSDVIDHIFLSKFNSSNYVGTYAVGTRKTRGILVNRPWLHIEYVT